MLISCENCNKKFDINKDLIPKKGRLLQCSSCDHKWYFKHEIIQKNEEAIKDDVLEVFENIDSKENKSLENNDKINLPKEKKVKKHSTVNKKKEKKSHFFNLTLVFIVSLSAIIILIDTFKYPIAKIVPNIEFLLYNLYESFKDIFFFIKDLI
tara:strand:+ start:192 stop:650 length:459 start_codon:yes stop_codon:yes gene_type:complete